MVSYNFTDRRKKVYQGYLEGKHPRDIGRENKLSGMKVSLIIKRVKEKVPKADLDKIQAIVDRQHKKS
jgi:hypothetical protein